MNSTLTVDTTEQVQGKTWHASRTLYGPDERRGARSRCARSACPVHPSFTLTTTWHLRSRSSALLLLCPPARLRERRSVPERAPNTALLLLAPEDNLWNDLALPQRKKPPFCTSPPRSSVRVTPRQHHDHQIDDGRCDQSAKPPQAPQCRMLQTHIRLDSKYAALKMRRAGLPTARLGVAL